MLFLGVYMGALTFFWPWPGIVSAQDVQSPHSAAACLECHKSPHGGGEGIPSVIVPEDGDPHRVLSNSCSECHPGETPPFWLIIFPGDKPSKVKAAAPSGTRPTFPNSHDAMECGRCHAKEVSFDRSDGEEGKLVDYSGDITAFCQRCHENIIEEHFPRGNVPGGGTSCLTCHQIHRPSYVFPALREDYYTFIRETKSINPHGGKLFCLSCHPNKPASGEAAELLFGPRELDSLCTRCHPDTDHHLLGQPSSQNTWKMDFLNYPTREGWITCITCHDPPSCQEGLDKASAIFLRGEPYQKVTDFCRNCHEERGWEQFNPHDQIDPAGEVISRACLFCHADLPDPEVEYDIYSMEFNDDLSSICIQCHENFPHPDKDHMVAPSEDVLASMKEYEERREVMLPLDFDGRLTCATCHNPHERGLLTGPDSVGADEEKRLRLTTFNEVCTPCHGRH